MKVGARINDLNQRKRSCSRPSKKGLDGSFPQNRGRGGGGEVG